jgi:2-polyprenyl-3-methyl-5-hydroxy-6-metoxy-1,4-benzoquinol methylase
VKFLDRYLQSARIKRGRPFVKQGDVVVDVGCADGAMFREWQALIGRGVGVDPALDKHETGPNYELCPGNFPEAVPDDVQADLITMFAVLEHIPPERQAELAKACSAMLKPGGRIVATVPSPRVDSILHVLAALRLVDGIAVHEHYGFRPDKVPGIFPAPAYRLERWQRFQFGLNNLFVFEKV